MRKKFITALELSEMVRIPVKTLSDWRSQKTGPPYRRVGRHVIYDPEEIELWLETRKVMPMAN